MAAFPHFICKCARSLQTGFALLLLLILGSTHARIVNLDDYAYNEVEDELDLPFANSPFLAKMLEGNVLAKTRRRRHGVYEECCRRGCSFGELLSYCK